MNKFPLRPSGNNLNSFNKCLLTDFKKDLPLILPITFDYCSRHVRGARFSYHQHPATSQSLLLSMPSSWSAQTCRLKAPLNVSKTLLQLLTLPSGKRFCRSSQGLRILKSRARARDLTLTEALTSDPNQVLPTVSSTPKGQGREAPGLGLPDQESTHHKAIQEALIRVQPLTKFKIKFT